MRAITQRYLDWRIGDYVGDNLLDLIVEHGELLDKLDKFAIESMLHSRDGSQADILTTIPTLKIWPTLKFFARFEVFLCVSAFHKEISRSADSEWLDSLVLWLKTCDDEHWRNALALCRKASDSEEDGDKQAALGAGEHMFEMFRNDIVTNVASFSHCIEATRKMRFDNGFAIRDAQRDRFMRLMRGRPGGW